MSEPDNHAPDTLPADFFSQPQKPPDTLPADFFSTQQQANAADKQQDVFKAAPKFGTLNWLKEKGWNALEGAIESLPGAGAITGGLLGGTTGAASLGIGAAPGTVIGAGLGGAGGEAARQTIRQQLGWDTPQTAGQSAGQIGKQGAFQAMWAMLGELGQLGGVAGINKLRSLPGFNLLTQEEKNAVEFGVSRGVPLDAGTATGNQFVKATQKLSDYTLPGSVVAGKARLQQAGAMGRVGSELGEAASPGMAQVPESAGAGVQQALTDKISQLKQDADTAYDAYRDIVNAPANVKSVQVGQKTVQSPFLDQFGRPQSTTVPITQDIATPVDVRQLKQDFQPILQDMDKWMQPAKKDASAGYQALSSIVNGPDYLPAAVAEKGLGGLKSLAREAQSPDMANVSQGLGKYAAQRLQSQIDQAVYDTGGSDAITALQQGRAIHAQKMATADVLESLRDEPVQAFNQLTMAKDAGIDKLREVAAMVPQQMPQIGRAYVDDMITKATASGGYEGGAGMWSRWQNLGPETKKILFPDARLRGDLDNFFLLGKRLAENPNPSGSALTGSVAGQAAILFHNPWTGAAYTISGYGLAKMLRSPAMIEALVNGMQPPVGAAATRAAVSGAGKALVIGNLLKQAGKYAVQVRSDQDAAQFQPAFGSEPAPPSLQ